MGSVSYRQWRADGFADGESCGCRVADDGLLLDVPTETTAYADSVHGGTDRSYEYGSWRSPAIAGMSAAAEIVPSWNARTPPGTWVEVALLIGSGADANRYVLGRWASDSSTIHRTTVPAQHDGLAQVDVDTLVAVGGHDTGFAEYRVEVRLLRAAGSTASPVLTLVGVMCSTARPAARAGIDTGPGSAVGSALDVPAYSQAMHKGQYRQWASGGASWCSPTATSMVLGYWKSGPRAADYAWVDSEIADPQVVYAAAATYDHAYAGTGNWGFNAAYAGRWSTPQGVPVEAFVTRLRSLADAEPFIAAGIPLVAAVAFEKADLPSAGYRTDGHLVVISGFTGAGDVVTDDPASHGLASNDAVRTVYPRRQLAAAWLGHSGGIVYVIHPLDVPLPSVAGDQPW